MEQKKLKVVLTGGPGVGKTSILGCLRRAGFEVKSEVFTELFESAQLKTGLASLFQDPQKLLHDLVVRQRELEAPSLESGILFYDRGMVDIMGFAGNLGLEFTNADLKLVSESEY